MVAQINKSYFRHSPAKTFTRLLSYSLFEGRPLTTKGRWMNPVVLAIARMAARAGPANKVKKPIFIIGSGRSGTTVLGTVLSLHHAVGFLNEPKALWYVAYPHEDVVGNYSDTDGRYRLSGQDASVEVQQRIRSIYGAYLQLTRSTRVVDKYPELVFRVPFIHRIFPDAKFLFVVRDGIDTCQSIAKWSRRFGYESSQGYSGWWGLGGRKWRLMLKELVPEDRQLSARYESIVRFDKPIDMAAVEWVLTMREGLSALKEYAGIVEMVRYEDLVASPADTLMSVMKFCELELDNSVLKYGVETLKGDRSHDGITLDPSIQDAFDDTMSRLGYAQAAR